MAKQICLKVQLQRSICQSSQGGGQTKDTGEQAESIFKRGRLGKTRKEQSRKELKEVEEVEGVEEVEEVEEVKEVEEGRRYIR